MTEKELREQLIDLVQKYQESNNVTVETIDFDWLPRHGTLSLLNQVRIETCQNNNC